MIPDPLKVALFKDKIRSIFRKNINLNSYQLVELVNPVLRGWANYYRIANAGSTFSKMSGFVWGLQFRWALSKMANVSKSVIIDRFF